MPRIIHPQQFILGLLTFVAISVGYVMLTDKNPQIQRLKRDKPYLNLAIILILSAFLFNLFGSLMTFLFSICMPLSGKLFIMKSPSRNSFSIKIDISYQFQVIFLHAALRLRNIKNKIANKIELIGVSRTPMGFLLEQLGATHEAAS